MSRLGLRRWPLTPAGSAIVGLLLGAALAGALAWMVGGP